MNGMDDYYVEGGWILLSRKLLASRAWKICNHKQKVMLIVSLLSANHKDNPWWDGKDHISVARGSFVTSRDKFAVITETTPRKVRTFWNKMEKIEFLTIKTTNRHTMITICNYGVYQNPELYMCPSKRPMKDQAPTTNNNVNNVNKKFSKESGNNGDLNHIQTIIEFYKQIKRYDSQPDWDKHHFKRHTRAAKELYKVAGPNWRESMEWVSLQGYSWTIETVVKKFPDFKNQKFTDEFEEEEPSHANPL